MRISDWSSDVCSSDLGQNGVVNLREHRLADGRGVHGRAPAGPEKGAHRRMALELSDVDQLVLVLPGAVNRLSDLLPQPAHDRPSAGDDAAVAQEGVARSEGRRVGKEGVRTGRIRGL